MLDKILFCKIFLQIIYLKFKLSFSFQFKTTTKDKILLRTDKPKQNIISKKQTKVNSYFK